MKKPKKPIISVGTYIIDAEGNKFPNDPFSHPVSFRIAAIVRTLETGISYTVEV